MSLEKDTGREDQLSYESPIRSIFQKFSKQKDVSLVYGEPIAHGEKLILPVAKVSYYAGGGGGLSKDNGKTPAGIGEGGMGKFSVKPIGVYEVNGKQTKFKPIMEPKHLLTFVAVVTIGVAWVMKRKS